MTRVASLTLQHVEFIPEQIASGVLYVSKRFKTATHLCCCGCGSRVVTPLNAAKWSLRESGGTASLHPSIGNWSLPCRSHYWIDRGTIRWAETFGPAQIKAVQARDLDAVLNPSTPARPAQPTAQPGIIKMLVNWIKGLFK